MSDTEHSEIEAAPQNEVKGIMRDYLTKNADKAKFFMTIVEKMSQHLFEKDGADEVYNLFWGGSKDDLKKIVAKANKREKREEEKFQPEGLKKPETAMTLFGRKFKEQCDAAGTKFSLIEKNKAWKLLSDKEKAKYQAEAKKQKDKYVAEYARLRASAIESGEFPEDKPKRPVTAFFLFLAEHRTQIENDGALLQSVRGDNEKATTNQLISKAAGELWKELPEKKRAKYEEQYKKNRAEFDEKLKAWTEKETARRKKQGGEPLEVKVVSNGGQKKTTKPVTKEASATEPETTDAEQTEHTEPEHTEPEQTEPEHTDAEEEKPKKKASKSKKDKENVEEKAEKAEKAEKTEKAEKPKKNGKAKAN